MAEKANKSAKKPQSSSKTKPAAKKSTPVKPDAGQKKKLIKELSGLLEQIDEDGLLFLKKQASILIHNQTVVEINETREKKSSGKKGARKKTSAAQNIYEPVHVEKVGDKNFVIVVDNNRIFMTLDELKALVKICQHADDLKTAAAACFIWFKKERSDFISETGIRQPLDKKLAELVLHLTENFTTGKS